MRRSMSSAMFPTLCSRCSSAKVASIWRMAMTLAVEVMMITASTSMKLPNVNWPIESENDRGGSEFGGVSAVMWLGPGSCRPNIRCISGRGEHARASAGEGKSAGPRPGTTLRMASGTIIPARARITRPKSPAPPPSISGDAGLLDHLGPHRDVGLDDIGERLPRRALGLAAGHVEPFLDVGCGQRHLQRLADLRHDRLRCSLRYHDAEPRRHLGLGKALFGQGPRVREIFRAAFADGADDPDRPALHLRHRLVGG